MNLKEVCSSLLDSLKKGLEPIRSAVSNLSSAMVEIDDRLKSVESRQMVAGPRGEQGEKGLPGERGEKGEVGSQGERGPQGEKGLQGERGEAGAMGERGEVGSRGEKGDQGIPGERGATGEAGPQGERGLPGDAGPAGERGPAGEKGVDGVKGDVGDIGPAGAQGERGDKGERGEPGQKGEPGRDAEPIDIADVVRELIKAPEILPVLSLLIADAMAKHFAENPVRDGKDGAKGEAGERGEKGVPGEKGADGCGVSDLLIDREGALIATMTDGRMKSLGVVVGKNGVDGKDGAGVDGVSLEYDETTHEVVERWSAGGTAKELRRPAGGIHAMGYWRDGTKAKANQAWTHDGSLWIARKDTTTKPCYESGDWQLAAKKGRDTKPEVRINPDKPAKPVSLNGGANA